jgi:hypothetical protein
MNCAVSDNLSNKNWSEVADELNTQLGKAIFGDISAEQAIDDAAGKGQQLLSGG